MRSDDINVQQLFQDRRQFLVPFYQRAYVWTLQGQWQQLWEDIRAKAEDRLFGHVTGPHFLGAVVLDPQPKDGIIGVEALHIIDGQQRLTTLQFVLKSLLFAIEPHGCAGIREIVTGAMRNGNPDTMREPDVERYKVWPTFRDRDDYPTAIEAKSRDELMAAFRGSFTQRLSLRRYGAHPPALEAIWFFTDEFQRWIGEGDTTSRLTRADALANAVLRDLKVVSIVLGPEDDAQVIFETLNGRGAQLNATDLIRNFIFMRADREGAGAKGLYDTLWRGFEQPYWSEDLRRGRMRKPKLEWFVHATLQAELQEEVDLGRLYFEYRRYVFCASPPRPAEAQLATLGKYAAHYRALVDGAPGTAMGRFGRRIAAFDLTTVHPLALLIAASPLTDDDKEEMLGYLVSYVVRRAVCGLTSKNYNNVFLSLLRSLSRTTVSPAALCEALSALAGEASRWPGDGEFRNACVTTPLYPGTLDAAATRLILAELERQLRDQARTEDAFGSDFGNLDIDHIMPQSWYEHWPLGELGDVHSSEPLAARLKELSGQQVTDRERAVVGREDGVRTLGNLTFLNLSVNRQAQNKAFPLKRDLLIANTNLRLNVPLIAQQEWDEARIRERGQVLAQAALCVWPGPQGGA